MGGAHGGVAQCSMRKRTYTSLCSDEPALESDDMPVPVIHNWVSTAQIDGTSMPLDLEAIQQILPGSSYDRKKFAAMAIRLSNPCCTLLLFRWEEHIRALARRLPH